MLQAPLSSLLRITPYFRGKPRLARLLPATGVRRARVFGLNVKLDLADVIQRHIYGGVYEPAETHWVRSYLEPGMTFIDVGANVGYYTWLAASLVRESGRVLAFEPGAYAFARLKHAIAANGVSWADCRNVAVSDREGAITLYTPPESYGNHNPSVVRYCDSMTAMVVPATTIDRVRETAGLARIDLLKVDVEGHEPAVLRGAVRSARAGALRAILCEFNPDCLAGAGSNTACLQEWFAAHGFECVRQFPSRWGPVANRLFVYRGGYVS